MKGNDIRENYLSFFENKKDHLRLKSFSLIPKDDPSLLLIGAGMAPLKPYFTGKVEPPKHRVTTSQKCIRTGDIENVGRTARHHTFFEMLGNFSFGDYFKKEAISWAWEFLTEVLKLDQSRLYVTIYPDDNEAHDYWHKMIGLPENHIYPLSDNFWEIGEGPCGPDSEIFFDQGEEFGTDPENQMGGDGDRFLEIWNLVFSQYDRQKDGSYLPLAKKNIDTGAGLERLAAVLQKKKNNFETDLFFPIIEEASKLSGVSYGQSAEGDVALKVISDHARAITNMIADGILPSNEGRGYVLRRVLRRAVRFGKLLGIQDAFMGQMIDVVIQMMKPAYPELVDKQAFIKKVAGVEEERFHTTLNAGCDLLSEMLEDTKKKQQTILSGDQVFKLYDTYGFPWELTDEIAKEQGLTIDEKGFEAAMAEQKERARAARAKVSAKVATPDTTKLDAKELTTEDKDGETKLLLLGQDGKEIVSAADGTEVTVVLKNNPFHAEGGGQIGDSGTIVGEEGTIQVEDTKKLPDGIVYVIGTVPLTLACSLAMAVLLNQNVKLRNFFRTVAFFPYVASLVAVAAVWNMIFNPSMGPINMILNQFFGVAVENLPRWAAGKDTAMITVILFSVWKNMGYYMVIYLAGLQGCNPDLNEAAELDGANRWQQFWHITLPQLRPTTFFVVIMLTISGFKVYDQMYMITQGGPGTATMTLVYYIYNVAFVNTPKYGYASAISMVLFVLVLIVTIIQFRGSKGEN